MKDAAALLLSSIICILIMVAVYFVAGAILSVGWTSCMVPNFDVPPLGIPTAAAIVATLDLVRKTISLI